MKSVFGLHKQVNFAFFAPQWRQVTGENKIWHGESRLFHAIFYHHRCRDGVWEPEL